VNSPTLSFTSLLMKACIDISSNSSNGLTIDQFRLAKKAAKNNYEFLQHSYTALVVVAFLNLIGLSLIHSRAYSVSLTYNIAQLY